MLPLLVIAVAGGGPLARPAQAQIPGLPLSIPQIKAAASSLAGPSATSSAPASPDATAGAASAKAAVTVSGQTLFSLYADTQARAQDRADLVTFRLRQTLQGLSPDQPTPQVTAKPVGDEVVLLLGGKSLMTVTAADAAGTGESTAALSAEWSNQISAVLYQTLRERSPGYLRHAAYEAGVIVVVAALLNALLWIVLRRLLDRPGWVTQAFVWVIAVYLITGLFPATRPLHALVGTGVLRPFSIVIFVILAASIATRILRVAVTHLLPPMSDKLSPEERTERTFRRRATLGAVSRITGVTIIWTFALVGALSWIGVNLSALLTSAGLVGVVIGLAAQDTMKDLVAGINILIDDRFGVGDVIQVGTFSGTVEKLNLRITQIRDLQGRLITFPNRSIEMVANATARWAQVDFQISVGYDADMTKAMQAMVDTAKALREEMPHQVLDEPQMLGVDSYHDSSVTLRMLLRTVPGDQWAVARELNLRIIKAFDAAKIAIPPSAAPASPVVLVEKPTGEVALAASDPAAKAAVPPQGRQISGATA